MALDPIVWALKDAPVKDAGERLILTILAEHANEDGTRAFPSQKTIAAYAMLTDRSVRDKLRSLEERGLIVRGDQRIVTHFPADKRPVVWDLAIPYSWWGVRWERMNRTRTTLGLKPLRPEDRPDLIEPEPKTAKIRKIKPDDGAAGNRFRPEGGSGRNEVPERPEPVSGRGRNVVPTTLPIYPPHDPPLSLADSVDEDTDGGRGPQPLIQAPGAPRVTEPVDLFDEFWKVWPKRVGKQAAVRAWRAALRGGADPAAVVAAARELAAHPLCPKPRDPRMRFVPDPSTWLNRAGWADEYPIWRRWEDDEAEKGSRRGSRPTGFVQASAADLATYEQQLAAQWGTDEGGVSA